MKSYVKIIMFASIFVVAPLFIHAAVGDFLILQDIGSYKFITQTKNPLTKKIVQIPGYTTRNAPGMLAGADHFDLDHDDATYETDYESDIADLGVEVQITQHTNSDSDKWLLHEVERDFRTYYGLPDDSFAIKSIDNNVVLVFGAAGWTYRWVCGNKVVQIEYHDSQMSKPEPLEVVKAYLAKHPSTLPATTSAELRTAANKTTWIKDEMDRRLWLCDKWFMQLQLKKVEARQAYEASAKNMNIFLDYREKYYGIKAEDEKNLLSGYLMQNNGTGIKAKLKEYKDWWVVNKEKAISL